MLAPLSNYWGGEGVAPYPPPVPTPMKREHVWSICYLSAFGFIRGLQTINNENIKLKYLHFIKEI